MISTLINNYINMTNVIIYFLKRSPVISFIAMVLPSCSTMTSDVMGLVGLADLDKFSGKDMKDRDSERLRLRSHRTSGDRREVTIELLLDLKIF